MKQGVIVMNKKFLFAILFLITAIFLFQACDLPTETDNNDGEVCESQHYDVEFIYERVKKPIYDNPDDPCTDAVWVQLSWKRDGSFNDMEKIGPNKYKILLENVPVNEPRNLANYKQNDGKLAILVLDKRLWVGQETDPQCLTCVVTENVWARVPGKTGKVKLGSRTQPASITCTWPEAKEILFDLYCDGSIRP
jgi:hypothetical protein